MSSAGTVVTYTPSRNASTSLVETTLEELLAQPVERGQKDGPSFVPAAFSAARRQKRNVESVTALVLDFDKLSPEASDAAIAKVENRYQVWCYETYSDAPEARCFRLVLPFETPCDLVGDWPQIRRALLAHLELESEVDPACSDASRLYYLPRIPLDAPSAAQREVEFADGPRLDWRQFFAKTTRAAPRPPKAAPVERDLQRPIDLEVIREGLRRPSQDSRLGKHCRRLLFGEALTPPPALRKPGESSRYLAWRDVTAHVANLLEGWEDSAPIVEEVFRPSFASEVMASPEDHTEFDIIERLFESARASAPAYKAERAQRNAAAEAAFLRAVSRAGATGRTVKEETAAPSGQTSTAEPEAEAAGEDDGGRWEEQLQIVATKGGSYIKPSPSNLALILAKSPLFKGAFRYNDLTQGYEALKDLELPPAERSGEFVEMRDAMVTHVMNTISRIYELSYAESAVFSQVKQAAEKCRFDPVQDYLNSLRWDGRTRLGDVLPRYFGAEDSEWSRLVGRKWLTAAVARAMDPGCEAQNMLVFEGPEGLRKTTAMRSLFGKRFTGTLKHSIHDEQAIYVIHSLWCVEFGELDALRSREQTAVKLFVGESVDPFRPKYARLGTKKPRRCVFYGTTNEDDWNTSSTGARRFWPVVAVRTADYIAIEDDRDQIWAEAVAVYRQWKAENALPEWRGKDHPCQWWLTAAEEAIAKPIVEDRQPTDATAEQIQLWASKSKNEVRTKGATSLELIKDALSLGTDGATRGLETRVGIALRRLKWTRKPGRPARWFPPDALTPTSLVGDTRPEGKEVVNGHAIVRAGANGSFLGATVPTGAVKAGPAP